MTQHPTERTFPDEIHSLAPAPTRARPRFRRGAKAIREAAAAVPATYAIADCGWVFDVLRDGASIGWVDIGDTRLLPPEYREPGFTVRLDESSPALAQSSDLASALGHLIPDKGVAARLARGIVGRDIFQVTPRMSRLGDGLPEQDWQAFWIYDPGRLTLTATVGLYQVALEGLTTSARTLDTIFQVHNKPWCDATMAGMLLAALEELLMPQARLCSWGVERGPIEAASIGAERPPIS